MKKLLRDGEFFGVMKKPSPNFEGWLFFLWNHVGFESEVTDSKMVREEITITWLV